MVDVKYERGRHGGCACSTQAALGAAHSVRAAAPRPEGALPAADWPAPQPAPHDVCATPLPWLRARQQDEDLENSSVLPTVLAPSPSAWM